MNWDKLSLKQKADIIKLSVQSGITDLSEIRQLYNSSQQDKQDTDLSYTAGSIVDNLHKAAVEEKSLGTPSHNYDFTQSEEWANAHGYYPDSRGHRDDRVKKLSHPTHPSRGTWNSDKEFQLTNLGFEDPNYTIFGMADGNQDPQAILSYKGNIVLPELTVTPKGNYYNNSYDNVQIKLSKGGHVQRKNKFEDGGTIEPVDYETPWGITTRSRYRGQYTAPTSAIYFKSKEDRDAYAAQQDMSLYGNVLPELSITANKDNTTSTNMGSYSSNTQRRSSNRTYADRFYNMSDWDSLFGQTRVNLNKRAWQRNPQYMQNWTDAGNIAAAFTVTPFATAAGATIPSSVLPKIGNFLVKDIIIPGLAGGAVEELATSAFGRSPFQEMSDWLQSRGWNPFLADLAGHSFNPGYMLSGNVPQQLTRNIVGQTFKDIARDLPVRSGVQSIINEQNIIKSPLNRYIPYVQNYINPLRKGKQTVDSFQVDKNKFKYLLKNPRLTEYSASLTNPFKYYTTMEGPANQIIQQVLGSGAAADLAVNYKDRPWWIAMPEAYLVSRPFIRNWVNNRIYTLARNNYIAQKKFGETLSTFRNAHENLGSHYLLYGERVPPYFVGSPSNRVLEHYGLTKIGKLNNTDIYKSTEGGVTRYYSYRNNELVGISPEAGGRNPNVNQRDKNVDLTKLPLNNFYSFIQKHPEFNITVDEDGIINRANLGRIGRINRSTGRVEELKKSIFEDTPLETFDIANNTPYQGRITVNPDFTINYPQEYINIINRNVEEIKNNILRVPGLKLYGSTAGITGARFPHNAHDIEFYATPNQLKQLQSNRYFKGATNNGFGTYTFDIPLSNGRKQSVDINLLDQDPKTGNAIGIRAEELFKQYFPSEYNEALTQSVVTGKLEIPYTPEQLLEQVDPTIKTIMDSFFINPTLDNKSKHFYRPLVHILYSDPEKVSQAIHQYGQSLLGGKNAKFFPMQTSQLQDVQTNIAALKKIGVELPEGQLQIIAKDPQRMKNILDYWFVSDRTFNRYVQGTWPEELGGQGEGVINPEYFRRSALSWIAPDLETGQTNGGSVLGIGLNTVIGGDSGYTGFNSIRSQIQPDFQYINTDNLLKLIDEVNSNYGLLSSDFKPIVEQALTDLGISTNYINRNNSNILGDLSERVLESISNPSVIRGSADKAYNILGYLHDKGINALARTPGKFGSLGSSYSSLTFTPNPRTTNIGFSRQIPQYKNLGLTFRIQDLLDNPKNLLSKHVYYRGVPLYERVVPEFLK